MKILSIVTMDRATFEKGPSPATRELMEALCAQMKKEGVLLETGGKCEAELELTVARKNGTYTVTDGPFAEAKEVVGGFALLEVSGRDEAIQITRRFLDHFDDDATCHLHEVNLPLESETPAMKTLQRMNA